MKVLEKLDEETSKVQQLKEQMTQNKDLIQRDLQQEMEILAKKREAEELERKLQFEAQKKRDEAMRKKNELMEDLRSTMQIRVREVLNQLSQRGLKKVGKDRIVDLERREEDLDYDSIMTFYQQVLRRE